MLKELNIIKFKVLEDTKLEIKPLTIFCGENSSGKSTAIIACMLAGNYKNYTSYIKDRIIAVNGKIEYTFSNNINSSINIDNGVIQENQNKNIKYTFLQADRVSPDKQYDITTDDNLGIRGEYAPYIYSIKQHDNIVELSINNDNENDINTTLRSQTAYWMKYILGTTVKADRQADKVSLYYQAPHDVEAYSPLNTGFGTSMVFPILIACLTAKIGDTVIIENPEVHLHPKAQSKLADFFAFIAQLGVQVILETHCEHLIYKLCYNVNQGIIDYDKVVFQYKEINKPFQAIYTDKKGRFVDKENNQRKFPTGFFDATPTYYLKIYR